MLHDAFRLGNWVTSTPTEKLPTALRTRVGGQIATANKVMFDIHCSCLHPKRVREDWEEAAYHQPATGDKNHNACGFVEPPLHSSVAMKREMLPFLPMQNCWE